HAGTRFRTILWRLTSLQSRLPARPGRSTGGTGMTDFTEAELDALKSTAIGRKALRVIAKLEKDADLERRIAALEAANASTATYPSSLMADHRIFGACAFCGQSL